jgi:hypothetical protein
MKIMAFLGVGLLVAGFASAANTFVVQPYAALNGTNYGAEVTIDGSTNDVYVEDQTPNAETIYRATFWLDPNTISISPADRFPIFLGRTAAGNNVIRLQLQIKWDAPIYRIRLQMKKNDQTWMNAVSGTGVQFLPIPDGPVQVTLETRFGTNDPTTGSLVRLTANGQTYELTGFYSTNWSIDHVRLGAPRQSQAIGTFSGSIYLDEFASFRTLAP